MPEGSAGAFQELPGTVTKGVGGLWSGVLTVPVSTPPGAYSLSAYCLASHAVTSFYPSVRITIDDPSVSTTTSTTAPNASARTFRVTPSPMTVGQRVTFSGAGCPHGDVARVFIDAGSTTSGTTALAHPGVDQRWRVTVPVGDSTMLGSRLASAVCSPSPGTAPIFEYRPVTVDVKSWRRMQVAPGTAVRPGTTLDVTAVGACPYPDISRATVTFQLPGDDEHVFRAVYGTIAQRADGHWTARVAIPAGTPPGAYELVGTCVYSRSYQAFYPTVAVTVRAKG